MTEQETVNRWAELRGFFNDPANVDEIEPAATGIDEALYLNVKDSVAHFRGNGITEEEAEGILSVLSPEWDGNGFVAGLTDGDKAALVQVAGILAEYRFIENLQRMFGDSETPEDN